ncbi:MAG: transposase [Dysgonamonadaceae bacterium]|jgi:transposase|nr:transposase [Dysgonamonadaceae bacterium]
MYIHTTKQKLYFAKVIKLHYDRGYGEDRISRILPIGHSTVSRWIRIFAAENEIQSDVMQKKKTERQPSPVDIQATDPQSLQAEVVRLRAQLQEERLRADAFDEMINVAESKFKISIRKKVGVKR